MENFFYRVKCGDTLKSVCIRFNAPIFKVIEINKLNCEIEEGDIIEIVSLKNAKEYFVAPFDTIDSIAKKFNIKKEELTEKNGVDYAVYGTVLYI